MNRRALALRGWVAGALLLAGAIAPGCTCSRGKTQVEVTPAADSGEEDEDRVRPNYDLTGPVDPLAKRLCEALYQLPADRRAACCPGGPAQGFNTASQCTPMLSAALRLGGVTVKPEAVDLCIAAMTAAHVGCSWVGPNEVPLPAECSDLFTGTVAAGAKCRSSLECQGTLRCAGVGPTDVGRCAPAGPPGSRCDTAVDALAAFTRQEAALHPECDGFCQRRICRPALGADGACLIGLQCPRGKHCADGACVDGAFARLGEKCSTGGCERGLRCVKDICRAPAADGTACTSHLECQGACIPSKSGARCGQGCEFR